MCHGENRYGFFVEFDITNSCHLQLAFLEFYPFKEVKYVKSLSFTEFTPTLFYLLSHKLLILNNLQIPWLQILAVRHHPQLRDEHWRLGVLELLILAVRLHPRLRDEHWRQSVWLVQILAVRYHP